MKHFAILVLLAAAFAARATPLPSPKVQAHALVQECIDSPTHCMAAADYNALLEGASSVANVRNFGASGSSYTTFGVTTAGNANVPLTAIGDFVVGNNVWVAGSGAAGADLVATITAINGNTITVSPAPSTSLGNPQVTHDDTAAIQAAINYFTQGGPVYLPAGYYRISAPGASGTALTFRNGTSMSGAAIELYTAPDGRGTTIDGFHVNGTATTAINMVGDGSAWTRLAHLLMTGSLTNTNNFAIKTGTGNLIDDVYISGFSTAIYNNQGADLLISRVTTQGPGMAGILLSGSHDVRIWHSRLTNQGAGRAGAGGLGNLDIIGVPGKSLNIEIDSTVIDENFGSATPNVHIDANAKRVFFRDVLILANDTPANSGYGLYMEGTASELYMTNCKLDTFGGAGTAGMIYLATGATGVVLQHIITVPHGGTDIVDNSTGAIWVNVNGKYKLQLPTSNPGAGLLWNDTGTVKVGT